MSKRYIDTVDVAKMVRKVLKKNFAGQKFSVRSDRYAGGSSIRVSWIDGPTEKEVSAVAGWLHGSTFDGMIDLKSYHDTVLDTGEEVRLGNDFIFFDRESSDEAKAAMAKKIEAVIGEPFDKNKRYKAFNDYETGEVKLHSTQEEYGYHLLGMALGKQSLYEKKEEKVKA